MSMTDVRPHLLSAFAGLDIDKKVDEGPYEGHITIFEGGAQFTSDTTTQICHET